ncbi:MAG: hypothetical protein KF841_02945 [Phycisphaerae bacterium]|nr:hypothetical protein [Phycisphaerae bacterium]
MDQRVPAAGGLLGVVLGSVPVVPKETQLLFLAGAPACLAWIAATTFGHARSKEDHLRRIDEIERHVNQIAGEELLVFQSQHPNRQAVTAGRTGAAAIMAVASACLIAFAACAFLFQTQTNVPPPLAMAYNGYVLVSAGYVAVAFRSLRRYRYRRSPASPRLPFAAMRHE